MKKGIFLFIFMSCASVYSQVAIGKTTLESASSSLEFGTENKGLVLPWITNISGVLNPVNGTLIFDLSDKKVKVYQNNIWKDLSIDTTGMADTGLQDILQENSMAKMSIGAPTATSGILVLEDIDKAMILPKVTSPHLNIISPSAGMMVYDTTKKQLAVFNGSVWTFWSE